MYRSNLPQSAADRIAVATTALAVAAIVWLILAVAPDAANASPTSAHAATERHVDESSRAAPQANHAGADCAGAAFAAR